MSAAAVCPFAERRADLDRATAFLRRRGILVSVVNREAAIRTYRVTGRAEAKLLEDVVAIAIAHGMEARA